MKAVLRVVLILAVTSCNEEPAKPLDQMGRLQAGNLSDDDLKKVAAIMPGMTESCIALVRKDGINAIPERTENCFKMTPQRRWTGLWRNAFEVSTFCADEPEKVAAECPTGPGGTWLEPAAGVVPDEALYRVEFIGRRTAQPAHFGHMGMYDHEIVVDRMTSKTLVSK